MADYNDQCVPEMEDCNSLTASNEQCVEAESACRGAVDYPIYYSLDDDFDVYDIRSGIQQPPAQYSDYLSESEVMSAIGARSYFTECNRAVSDNFYETGDRMCPHFAFLKPNSDWSNRCQILPIHSIISYTVGHHDCHLGWRCGFYLQLGWKPCGGRCS
jgi:hypothetical protein